MCDATHGHDQTVSDGWCAQAMLANWQLVLVPAELLLLADPSHRSDATDCGHAQVNPSAKYTCPYI